MDANVYYILTCIHEFKNKSFTVFVLVVQRLCNNIYNYLLKWRQSPYCHEKMQYVIEKGKRMEKKTLIFMAI